MRKPRFGPTKPKLVAKVRRSSAQVYGTRDSWSELTTRIKQRDGYKCRICGSADYLQIDHIIPAHRGGHSVPANLWTLCAYCHAKRPGHKAAKHLILHQTKNETFGRYKL
jgi:5-methylcytosine-specific restriction endonuclease McrA